jgi:ribosome-associated protein
MSTASELPDENAPAHDEETIRLGQFLKWANLAETGGEARELVQGGYVRVDGAVETRRGRRLHLGQRVTLAYPGEPEVTVVVEDL